MKFFVLDTNVILHDCQSILKFAGNTVILPMTVLEEIDHFKKEMNELGRNARHFSKMMDDLRARGGLVEGVPLNDEGGILQVAFCDAEARAAVPLEMDMAVADNRILAVANHFTCRQSRRVILVTNDTNMRIKADAMGIQAEAYENGSVDFESLYTGVREVVDELPEEFEPPLAPNEYIRVVSGFTGELIQLYRVYQCGDCHVITPLGDDKEAWGFVPRNDEQRMALDLLMDDDIKLVTLVGKAGTGKTLCAIAAGLQKVTPEFTYRKLLVSRPVFPMGKDIGFLPGDIMEKLAPYMQPIYDNVEFLMAGYSITGSSSTRLKRNNEKPEKVEKPKKTRSKSKGYDDTDPYLKRAEECDKADAAFDKGYKELLAAGIMEVEPLLYIRGRSIPQQYLIVDEAQNLTPHEIKTIVTRAGVGTKIVLTGDPYQIDNPYVDASSNGLSFIVERFRNEKIAGHITLTKGERSELAEIASNIL